MSNFPYNSEIHKDEHRKENNAKAVDLYGWDVDNLEWVRLSVQPDGKLKTVNSAGDLVFSNSNPVQSSTFTITKTVNGTQYVKTYGMNSSDELISISDWT